VNAPRVGARHVQIFLYEKSQDFSFFTIQCKNFTSKYSSLLITAIACLRQAIAVLIKDQQFFDGHQMKRDEHLIPS
jgi:hypothetical protein